jgi:hypothetical protein
MSESPVFLQLAVGGIRQGVADFVSIQELADRAVECPGDGISPKGMGNFRLAQGPVGQGLEHEVA